MSSLDDHFTEWESEVFGYGYGTGEVYVLNLLKALLEGIPNGKHYDHCVLERRIGPGAAWLLINALCKADIIEYGDSPRFGLLTTKGVALKQYLSTKTAEELAELISNQDYSNKPDGVNPFL